MTVSPNNNSPNNDIRLPLDMLLTVDVDALENALECQWAVEYENEIQFCKNDDDLEELIEDMDNPKYYKIDEIEFDRINSAIDLLNMADENAMLGHILDRLLR